MSYHIYALKLNYSLSFLYSYCFARFSNVPWFINIYYYELTYHWILCTRNIKRSYHFSIDFNDRLFTLQELPWGNNENRLKTEVPNYCMSMQLPLVWGLLKAKCDVWLLANETEGYSDTKVHAFLSLQGRTKALLQNKLKLFDKVFVENTIVPLVS